jgi:hypothetical protein
MLCFFINECVEDVIGNLKQCLQRKDFLRFNLKAKTMIVRYDNPLIIAYSEELDDEELIRNALDTLQFVDIYFCLYDKNIDIVVKMMLIIKIKQFVFLVILWQFLLVEVCDFVWFKCYFSFEFEEIGGIPCDGDIVRSNTRSAPYRSCFCGSNLGNINYFIGIWYAFINEIMYNTFR